MRERGRGVRGGWWENTYTQLFRPPQSSYKTMTQHDKKGGFNAANAPPMLRKIYGGSVKKGISFWACSVMCELLRTEQEDERGDGADDQDGDLKI